MTTMFLNRFVRFAQLSAQNSEDFFRWFVGDAGCIGVQHVSETSFSYNQSFTHLGKMLTLGGSKDMHLLFF